MAQVPRQQVTDGRLIFDDQDPGVLGSLMAVVRAEQRMTAM